MISRYPFTEQQQVNGRTKQYKHSLCRSTQAKQLFFVMAMIILLISPAQAVNKPSPVKPPITAYIAIIIDDLGYKLKHDQRALELPGPVTFAFLPFTPQAGRLAEKAHNRGNEVMLHLPMQSIEPVKIGPGALTKDMGREQFKISVLKSILSIPHVRGVNNHMGSLITSEQQQMNWLMEELARTSLFFVDSRTTSKTVGQKTAARFNVANTQRNIFLDHFRTPQAIETKFDQLIKLAKKNGAAVGIGHPHPATMDILEKKIPQLVAAGIRLVPVSELIHKQYLISQAKQKKKLKETSALTNNQALHSYPQHKHREGK